MKTFISRIALVATIAGLGAIALGGGPSLSEEVGRVGVDWIGNDIVIDAIEDPKVAGVTCHVAFFDRSLIDRLQQGNWFEDPSNSSIDCVQTGAISIGNIDLDRNGEEVFQERRSLIFKSLVVNRIYDEDRQALVYLANSRQVNQGSAKMSISVVPLLNADVVWENGDPSQRVEPVK